MRTVNGSPRLTAVEVSSGLWQDLSELLKARLAERRRENDNDKDAIATARLRGVIATYKEILALAETPTPEPETDEPD